MMIEKKISRRQTLKLLAASSGAGFAAACSHPFNIGRSGQSKMRPRPDLLPRNADSALELYQLSHDEIPSGHVYMEAQIFTPDSQRLVYRRAAHSHDGDRYSPEHRLILCDLENGGELSPLTNELGVAGPSISPDGQLLYYFVGDRTGDTETILLKQVRLDGTERETLHVIDSPLPGTNYRPNRLYPLSTISSDGKRIAISCFLGDGQTENAPYGLLVYDLEKADVQLVLTGLTWLNMHPQYSRSLDPDASHDILVQENHGGKYDLTGMVLPGKLVGGQGADIHVIRDDGTDFRTMPCGRDTRVETCQGHQCWRGREETAVIGTVGAPRPGKETKLELIQGRAIPDKGHLGLHTPGAQRNDLSRSFDEPRFSHFGVDIAGTRILSDSPTRESWLIHAAEWGTGDGEPLQNWHFILNANSTYAKRAHPHPFLSPDGNRGFFNSDESGILRPYVIAGL